MGLGGMGLSWGWHVVSMGWNGVGMGRMGPHPTPCQMPAPCQPHANPMPTPCGRVQKITREQRKKKQARGRLLFAALALGQQHRRHCHQSTPSLLIYLLSKHGWPTCRPASIWHLAVGGKYARKEPTYLHIYGRSQQEEIRPTDLST
jgi:hypothetical protein